MLTLSFKNHIAEDVEFQEMGMSFDVKFKRPPVELDALDMKFCNEVWKKTKIGRGEALKFRYGEMLTISNLKNADPLVINGKIIDHIETNIDHVRQKMEYPPDGKGPGGDLGYDSTLALSVTDRSWDRYIAIADASQFGKEDPTLKIKYKTNAWQHYRIHGHDELGNHPHADELKNNHQHVHAAFNEKGAKKTASFVALWDKLFESDKPVTLRRKVAITPDKAGQIKNYDPDMWNKYKDEAEKEVMDMVKRRTGAKSIVKTSADRYFVDVGDTGAVDSENLFKIKSLTADDVEEMISRAFQRLKDHSGAKEYRGGKVLDFSHSVWRRSKIATIIRVIDRRTYFRSKGKLSSDAKYVPGGGQVKGKGVVSLQVGTGDDTVTTTDKTNYSGWVDKARDADKYMSIVGEYVHLRQAGSSHEQAFAKINATKPMDIETKEVLDEVHEVIEGYQHLIKNGYSHFKAIQQVIASKGKSNEDYLDAHHIEQILHQLTGQKVEPVEKHGIDPAVASSLRLAYEKLLDQFEDHDEAVEELLDKIDKNAMQSLGITAPQLKAFLASMKHAPATAPVKAEGFKGYLVQKLLKEVLGATFAIIDPKELRKKNRDWQPEGTGNPGFPRKRKKK